MDIKADSKSIKDLKDYFFIVPDYQREYVWQAEDHVTRFLQDINEEFQPNTKFQNNYFIGSTIIVKRTDGAYDVIDGQQRLTTIVLSLCAMRTILKTLDAQEKELLTLKDAFYKVITELLYTFDITNRKNTPRLVLQYEESKDYLSKLITDEEFSDSITPSITRMKEAHQTILDFLVDLLKVDGWLLINYVGYFLDNVKMVIIQPDSLGSALKIFETINQRGAGLDAMDLLKNLLFSHASKDDFEIIKQTWKEMLKSIHQSGEGDNPLRFLRYFLMARYHDGVIREDGIYKWIISKEGRDKINYIPNPVGFAKELKIASNKYAAFVKATGAWEADPLFPAITGIGYLSKKTSRQHLVLLMALKEDVENDTINLLARNIESLVFYYTLNRTLTKSYEEKFASWAIKLRSVYSIENLKHFLENDFQEELRDQQNKLEPLFAYKVQSDLNPQYRIKFILGRLENYIRTKVHFPASSFGHYQYQQLEHILPQTGINRSKDEYPETYDYSNTVQRLGNLTLLEAPINQSINNFNDLSNNDWFEGKKAAYLNSTIFLTKTFSEIKIGDKTAFNGFATQHLKSFTHWNKEAVTERQEIIKKLVFEIWKLES